MNAVSLPPVYFLVVDDRESNLLTLEALLRREGLVLLKATSGTEALEYLLHYDVALALVDVQMPGMDGYELAELMRSTERTRRIPIIFITAGTADNQRRFRGYEAGAVDFLHKPVEPDILKGKAAVFFELYRQRQELTATMIENERLLEESQQFATALQEADRRKDSFLAVLAHELRNPLAPLRNGLELIRRMPADSEMAAQAREMMSRQLGHMVRLIDDLLDVSRIANGKINLKFEMTELRGVIDLALETSRPQVDIGAHDLTVDYPDEKIWVNADITRLAQMISNLVTNAAKYTPAKGKILIEVRRQERQVTIKVTDNGLGIPPEMLSEVFVMFTQVNRTLDRSQGGLGIGLALVKWLAELHGGTIAVESEGSGLGSTFTLCIPAEAGMVPSGNVELGQNEVVSGVQLRILVVDDNIDSAESLAMMLTLDGHQVRTSHEGTDAILVAKEFLPDVVFLDIGLPDMSGYEVARTLREEISLENTLLVAITGWGSDEDKRQGREAGFNEHLTKPVDSSHVEQILASLVRQRSGLE